MNALPPNVAAVLDRLTDPVLFIHGEIFHSQQVTAASKENRLSPHPYRRARESRTLGSMAEKVAVEKVVFATLTGAVRWSGGTTLLRKGRRYAASDPLVVERPTLFQAGDPGNEPRSTVPPRPTRRCWVCGAEFAFRQGHMRYCGATCRRRRERWLAGMARKVLRGAGADPRRPDASCSVAEARGWLAGVVAHLDVVQRFSGYVVGRCDPGDAVGPGPRQSDPDIRWSLPGRGDLQAACRSEVPRLSEMVHGGREFVAAVERRAAEVARSRVRPADPDRAERLARLDDEVSGWLARLDGEPADV
jgi:hypothetical protein